MTRHLSHEICTFRPNRWVRVAGGFAFLVFVAVWLMAIETGLKPFYFAVTTVIAIVAGLGAIELLVSRVDVGRDVIAIKRLFNTERIALSRVVKVSADGRGIDLYLDSGTSKQLPEWLGVNTSARRRITDLLTENAR